MTIGPYRAINVAASAADSTPIGGGVILGGWSFAETAAATATVQIIDGNDAGGTVIAEISLAASGTATQAALGGIHARGGLFVKRLSGTFRYTLWVLPAENVLPYVLTQGVDAIRSGSE